MVFKPNSFTIQYKGRMNQLVTNVRVGVAYDPTKQPERERHELYQALWDTGASGSVITEKVVQNISPPHIGFTEVHTASETIRSPIYLVSIRLPGDVIFFDRRVTVGNLKGNFEVLIGMDIIGLSDFAVTSGNGNTTFSFRFPSSDNIDFTGKLLTQPPVPKVGRNDRCPCGSGKKYKYCHGK